MARTRKPKLLNISAIKKLQDTDFSKLNHKELVELCTDYNKTLAHHIDIGSINSLNSSLSPGNDIYKAKKSKIKDKTETFSENNTNSKSEDSSKEKSKRKPRAAGFGRKADGIAVDKVIKHIPHACSACKSSLSDDLAEHTITTFQYDMVFCGTKDMHLIKIENKFYSIKCNCGHIAKVETKDNLNNVELKKYHIIGPSLGAMMIYDYFSNHLSISKLQNSYYEKYGIAFSIGSIIECIHSNGLRLEPESIKIKDKVLSSDIVHADETSFKLKFKNQWVWLFSNGYDAFYTLGGRTKALADSILSDYTGMICSDGYKAYRDYALRIRCLAHIVRKIRRLLDSVVKEANEFGEYLNIFFDKLFFDVYMNREYVKSLPEDIQSEYSSLDYEVKLSKLKEACNRYKLSTDIKTKALAIELLKDWNNFFKVIDDTSLPLTNNVAERALRTLVIKRKISLSMQSLIGSKVLGIVYSVVTTLKNKQEGIISGLINILSPPNECAIRANDTSWKDKVIANQRRAEAC